MGIGRPPWGLISLLVPFGEPTFSSMTDAASFSPILESACTIFFRFSNFEAFEHW
jgi:hypothetical protein